MDKKKKIKGVLMATAILLFCMGTFFAMAKNDNSKTNDKAVAASAKIVRDYEKTNNGKSNATIHQEVVETVVSDLTVVAEEYKNKGQEKKAEITNQNQVNNPNIGDQNQEQEKIRNEEAEEDLNEEEIALVLEAVVEDAEKSSEETADAIEETEKQNKFKELLVGTDYKNLGQLRSSIAHYSNQIRQLERISQEEALSEEDRAIVGEKITALETEQAEIREIIRQEESTFSLLGWFFRFMYGYQPIDEVEEVETDLIDTPDTTEEITTDDTVDNTADDVVDDTIGGDATDEKNDDIVDDTGTTGDQVN